jgi:mycothiol synthase
MMMIDSLIFRRPMTDDAPQTLQLFIRCDIAEYGEPDSDLEDIQHEWGQIDLSRDAWLAFRPDGVLVGYAAVLPWGADLRYDIHVDPSWQDGTLGRALLERCEERGLALTAERGKEPDRQVRAYVAHVNDRDRQTFEQAGWRPGKYITQMQIDLDQPLPDPRWPAGVAVRSPILGQDERPIYELIQAAFHQPGRQPQEFEDWRTALMRPELFDPALWHLAIAKGEIVGVSLSFPYESMGWVRQLGVRESWRRQGIGAALLRHTFGEFKRRGFEKVGLTVESKRPAAFHFYQEVGMKPFRQYDEYLKRMTEGAEESP